MIGKSLRERYELGPLAEAKAITTLKELLATHARPLVEVRARDARMIACVVAGADKRAVRLCRDLGFQIKPGGTGVFGLMGADAARLFTQLRQDQRSWLESPCGPRETRVLLVAGGIALLSLETEGGAVSIRAVA